MNYEEFKEGMKKGIIGLLPEKYKTWTADVKKVNKVNEALDALLLSSREGNCAVPVIYIKKYYQAYQNGISMEDVLTAVAEEFLSAGAYLKDTPADYGLKNPQENIIYVLINTEKNRHLLENVPHRRIMDLSLIYRVVADMNDDGFNSAVVTKEMAEAFKMDEEALFRTAAENTPRIMPAEMAEIDEQFYIIGNSRGAFGAAAILYEGILEDMAEMLEKDFYIIPSSIHEVYVVPKDMIPASIVKTAILDANRTVVRPEDMLSDSLYCYSRTDHSLSVSG